ncbi:MAG: hypothetical protein AAF441_27790, partial [Pseudomonadota bacterium]
SFAFPHHRGPDLSAMSAQLPGLAEGRRFLFVARGVLRMRKPCHVRMDSVARAKRRWTKRRSGHVVGSSCESFWSLQDCVASAVRHGMPRDQARRALRDFQPQTREDT